MLVDRFIDTILAEASPADRQRSCKDSAWIDARSQTLFRKRHSSLSTPAQQTELLTMLAAEGSREDPAGIRFFSAMKSMTITGYYTTQAGLEQELGDDGVLAQASFAGCTHPEHQL